MTRVVEQVHRPEARRRAGAGHTPVVVVAGRPNVGKSSLVNRLVGRRVAVVELEPGVTRDRTMLTTEWNGMPFQVVDTGGWSPGRDALTAQVRKQAEHALASADLILFVVDAVAGLTEDDRTAVRVARRSGTPVRVVANKVDAAAHEPGIWEFVALGMGDPLPVSALHGRGAGELLDEVVRTLTGEGGPTGEDRGFAEGEPTSAGGSTSAGGGFAEAQGERRDGEPGEPGERVPSVAVVGRPNVGKSTLYNRLLGEERAIVHDLPGTTRDVIDTRLDTDEGPLRFLDTAGMRRPSRTRPGTEHHAVLRALDALDRADVAVLVIDATVGPSHQDQRLAERIGAAGCPAVVLVNKWDATSAERRDDVMAAVGERLPFLAAAPVLRISALTGRGVRGVLPAIRSVLVGYEQRVPTGVLNRALRELQAAHPAPAARIRYALQGATEPPTFTLFATARLPRTYLRYLERGLRERFDLGGTPLKLRVRIEGRRR